jgi:acyl-CoA synthetase (AMP-forming)/AMP-acid ligase II
MSATTLAELIEARAGDDRPGLVFGDRAWTWREYAAECAARAAWLVARARARAPRYVRISRELPQTPSHKVLKRLLAQQAWLTGDPVWWRPPGEPGFRRLTAEDLTAIENEFARYGRPHPPHRTTGPTALEG